MRDRELEQLFERYRSEGDLDALAEVFDRTARRLREVARHLARDEAQAEDLVQGVFVVAIERAQCFDVERELVAWLIGILANRAKQVRRREACEPDPERIVERTTTDPVGRAEVAEFAAALDAALAQVPEAYRDVLRIQLAEGHKPQEIARRLGREPGLVRVQLHRGLRHLRRALPPGFALGGAVLVAPSRGLAAVRDVVMEEAASANVALASGSSGVTLIGGAWMGKQVVVGVVTLLAGASLWLGMRDSSGLNKNIERVEVSHVEFEHRVDFFAAVSLRESRGQARASRRRV